LVNRRHIFLSYRSVEVEFALKLAADLKNAGLNLWIDRLDIKPGEDWRWSLQNAVDECAALIAVLTPEYVDSRYCRRELARADRFERPIIPVLLRPVPEKQWPMEIERHQYIDFTNWRDETIYKQRFSELETLCHTRYAAQFNEVPNEEKRYLTSLIAELEASKGITEYVELSHQASIVLHEEVMTRPRPRYAAAWTMEGAFSVVQEFEEAASARIYRPNVALKGIAEAVDRYQRFVLIGGPGTGKTTTIQHLALSAAYARMEDASKPLPLLVKLTNWQDQPYAEAFIRSQWPLSGDPITLMSEGKVALYLDGLNEMDNCGAERARQLREWFASASAPKNVIITCRADEYSESLNLHLPTVQAADLDRSRIQQFVRGYMDDGAAERLLDKILPTSSQIDDNARHLFQLARNPFLLSILILVFMRSPEGELPQNKGTLLKQLAAELWHQEQLRQTKDVIAYETIERSLSELAFSMVDNDMPIYVPKDYVRQYFGNELALEIAISARFLEREGTTLRFAHQLMQDYFAALGLMRKGLPTRLEQASLNSRGHRIPGKWDAVIVALCGITNQPEFIIRTVSEVDTLLGLECVASGLEIEPLTRDQTVTRALASMQGKLSHGRVAVAGLLTQMNHEAALPTLLWAMREGTWESRTAAYGIFQQTWIPDFPGLIDALQETNSEMREALSTALAQIGEEIIPNLLQLLRDERWYLRRSAAWALGEMQDKAAAPALALLVHDEPIVANEAITSLGVLKDPGAVPDLEDILLYGHWRVQHCAAEVLGWIGSPEAQTILLNALVSADEMIRCLAVEGLKFISNPVVHAALLKASYDESAEVRAAVVEALKDTEDANAVNRLIELLSDMSVVRSAKARVSDIAAKALAASGAKKAITAVEQWRKNHFGESTSGKPNKSSGIGLERLKEDLKGAQTAGEYGDLDSKDWMQRRRAVRQLANVDITFALPKLIAKLRDEDSQVRLAAVQVLTGIDNEIVTEGLISALGDADFSVCDAAAQGLAAQGKKVVGALSVALGSDNVNVRGGAVEALAKIGDKSAVQPLLKLLEDTAEPVLAGDRICDLAARALLSIGTSEARSTVKKWRETPLGKSFKETSTKRTIPQVEAEPASRPSNDPLMELLFDLHDQEWGKREETAKKLREYARNLKGKDASLDVQRLIGATQDEDWVVRWAASDALAWIGDRSAVPHIMRLLDDNNWTVRIGAIRNLIELKDEAALPALIELGNDENHNVREVVAESLGLFGQESSLDTIIQLADDDERFVRFAAVEALGRLGTERTHDPLIKALSDNHVTVRRAAVEAVRTMKIERSVPKLIELLQDTAGLEWEDDRICDMAAAALEHIGTPQAKAAAADWRRSQLELQ
jgi:HEAT repeat protein